MGFETNPRDNVTRKGGEGVVQSDHRLGSLKPQETLFKMTSDFG